MLKSFVKSFLLQPLVLVPQYYPFMVLRIGPLDDVLVLVWVLTCVLAVHLDETLVDSLFLVVLDQLLAHFRVLLNVVVLKFSLKRLLFAFKGLFQSFSWRCALTCLLLVGLDFGVRVAARFISPLFVSNRLRHSSAESEYFFLVVCDHLIHLVLLLELNRVVD